MNRSFPLILIFSFLFFFIFAINAHAYQVFNYNPSFDANTNGYIVSEDGGNVSYSWYDFLHWYPINNSYSCMSPAYDNATRELVLTSTGSCPSQTLTSEIITLMPTDNSAGLIYGKYSDVNNSFNNYNFILPKNKVGIIVLQMNISEWNGTQSYSDFNGDSFLIVQESGIVGNYTYADTLNQTSIGAGNGWKNYTIFIPATSTDRKISTYAFLHFGMTPSDSNYFLNNETFKVQLKKFQFYTLDVNEIRTDYSDASAEFLRYCNTTGMTDNMTIAGVPVLNNTDYAFGYDDNGLVCGFVKLDNLVIARYWNYYVPYTVSGCGYSFYGTNNLLFGRLDWYDENIFLMEKMYRTQIKITMLNSTDLGLTPFILYDDARNTTIPMQSFEDNYSTAFRQDINFLNNPSIAISNQNPSGNNFRFVCPAFNNSMSAWLPFFASNIQVDNTGWSCSDTANSEGYILPNGTEINIQYCGDFGCNADHTHCDFGFIGSYCDTNKTWVYSDAAGIQNSGTCTFKCLNETNGIECLDNSNIVYQCIDSGGNVADCEIVQNSTQSTNPYVNPAGSVASLLGSLFGIKDLATSELISSLIFSLLIGLGLIAVMSRLKVHGTILGQSFIISLLIFLVMFTMIGWFPGWLMIVLIVMSGLMVAKSLKVF